MVVVQPERIFSQGGLYCRQAVGVEYRLERHFYCISTVRAARRI